MAQRTPADIATALERRPARRLARAATRFAERLVGREGPSRLPHALTWRLRDRIWRARSIEVYHGKGKDRTARPRLLLVGNDLSRSGAPQVLAEMALLLVADHAVTVLSPWDGPWRAPLVAAGVDVVVDPKLREATSPLLHALQGTVDLVICNTLETGAAVSVLAASIPTIWYFHEVGVLRDRLEASPELCALLAVPARVWAVSHVGQEVLAQYRPDAAVVHYGLRPLVSHGTPEQPGIGDPLIIGVFGSIEPRKGQDLLLDALALLDDSVAAQLRIVCHGRVLDPDFNAALLARVVTLPTVEIGDALKADAYANAVRMCDAVLIASRDDPLPIAASDALGASRVVLCTRAVGTARLIEHGISGFVADAPEPLALARLLTEAVGRRAEWPIIAERGRTVFDKNFSLAAFDKALRAEFESILKYGI